MEFTKSDRQINDAVSKTGTVKAAMDNLTFEMMAKAQEGLIEHRRDGDATVYREYTRVDWYIVLDDTRGLAAALSIEYGHGEYTRTVYRKDGSSYEITVPASQPTYILTNATRLPRKGKRVPGSELKDS